MMTKHLPNVVKGSDLLLLSFAAVHRCREVVRPLFLFYNTVEGVEMTTTAVREKPMKTIHVFVPLPWANISAMQQVRTLRRWDALLCKDEYTRWRVTGTFTSLITVKTSTATMQVHFNKERVVLISSFLGLCLIKQLISPELRPRNVFTEAQSVVGFTRRMFPRGSAGLQDLAYINSWECWIVKSFL